MCDPLEDRLEEIRAVEQEIARLTCKLQADIYIAKKTADAIQQRNWRLQALEKQYDIDTQVS